MSLFMKECFLPSLFFCLLSTHLFHHDLVNVSLFVRLNIRDAQGDSVEQRPIGKTYPNT